MTPKKGSRKYAMKVKKNKYIYLQATTMIDLATGWIEIHSVLEDRVDLLTHQVELLW